MNKVIRVSAIGLLSALAFSGLTPSADAAIRPGKVWNMAGSPVRIKCSNGKYYTLYEKYPEKGSRSSEFCHDTNSFKSIDDRRCLTYVGPGWEDGKYKIAANAWRNVAGLATVTVRPYSNARCGNSLVFTFGK